mmetsp:Transcript_4680/g.6487  ORF Transcript_4680/g.6487 Transcript_4680/m.6487 type:complete len:535 (-) Transcript_4680:273-1877(-)|eukprot:CAMPEP_0194048530 /NCGR_PEP_ID=MMETSP0009_2-20130614/27589_1 /TAXON_ID=210454 /ORGANISM="Grammatophora oceanica, Strain CCMP 410" /LENGTH=534 /DNA_ID=CAMNT_0038694427 /DNA_START=214 /DNA_END=1818 /DNA_ORIENTATION=+
MWAFSNRLFGIALPILLLTCASRAFTRAGSISPAVVPISHGGATAATRNARNSNGTVEVPTGYNTSVSVFSTGSDGGDEEKRPLRVLFLSSDTGGGHRASAEALAKQFQLHYPGTSYDLIDVWTLDGVLPYRALVNSYKHLSSHPRQWWFFYHMSNTYINVLASNWHARKMCEKKIRKRIASYDPDVVVSVHPTMNNVPIKSTTQISKALGKHIPFFTVVTDLGSGHCMWFQPNVEKLYVASERIRKLAKRRGATPEDKIVMTGLPIRHDFAVQAEKMGDRTSVAGKEYQSTIKNALNIDNDKPMVLVMGGGEGVGSLSDIVNELYAKFTNQGIDATICVVCGRNEKLKEELNVRDWDKVLAVTNGRKTKRRSKFAKTKRSKPIQQALERLTGAPTSHAKGNVDVVGLGFISKMSDYMVAADVLVTKAGPGTIAEAASVGLPVMLTSYLPGQEAGNVNVVLDAGFGDYNRDPKLIATEVAVWLQDKDLLRTMSESTKRVGQPNAASDIAYDIGEITQDFMSLNGERKSALTLYT